MNLESPKVSVHKNQQELFDFLSDPKNYKQIMPESIEKFEVTAPDTFLFMLKGMPQIELQIKDVQEPNSIVLGSTSPKFDFTLNLDIVAISEKSSEVQLFFEGNFNAMMAMMVKSPLQKFIGALSTNISKL